MAIFSSNFSLNGACTQPFQRSSRLDRNNLTRATFNSPTAIAVAYSRSLPRSGTCASFSRRARFPRTDMKQQRRDANVGREGFRFGQF